MALEKTLIATEMNAKSAIEIHKRGLLVEDCWRLHHELPRMTLRLAVMRFFSDARLIQEKAFYDKNPAGPYIYTNHCFWLYQIDPVSNQAKAFVRMRPELQAFFKADIERNIINHLRGRGESAKEIAERIQTQRLDVRNASQKCLHCDHPDPVISRSLMRAKKGDSPDMVKFEYRCARCEASWCIEYAAVRVVQVDEPTRDPWAEPESFKEMIDATDDA